MTNEGKGRERLRIEMIRTDGETQSRMKINRSVVKEYAGAMREGVSFPPVVVFYDEEDHWLVDGFHRLEAAVLAGETEIDAEVREGSHRDAVLFSAGANSAHGLRRSNKDKRKAVMTLLYDGEWSQWSSREIATCCGVSHKLVNKLRKGLASGDKRQLRRTVKRGGKEYEMDVSKIGSRGAKEKPPADGHTKQQDGQASVPAASEDGSGANSSIIFVEFANLPGNHDDMCSLPVAELAADRSVLYMHAPCERLEEAKKVIEAWDFSLLFSGDVEAAEGQGETDVLLIATIGSQGLHEAIENMTPGSQRIELFPQDDRHEWIAWDETITPADNEDDPKQNDPAESEKPAKATTEKKPPLAQYDSDAEGPPKKPRGVLEGQLALII